MSVFDSKLFGALFLLYLEFCIIYVLYKRVRLTEIMLLRKKKDFQNGASSV